MKKGIKLLGILIATFTLLIDVKADTIDDEVYETNESIIEYIYNQLMTEYQSIDYPYYNISFQYGGLGQDYTVQDNSQSYITGLLYYFTENNNYSSDVGRIYIMYTCHPDCMYSTYRDLKGSNTYGGFYAGILELTDTFRNYAGNLLLQNGESPDYFINNIEERYKEVNLDNYEYVILSLKDYTQKNAFQTNIDVRGQIGITPVYNYGQTSKDAITGVQVQDRCNINYENYTEYPFYIIQTDLQNNVVYYVKECEENSSFKYDSEIFNITYITQENKNNPTITIDGNTYNVIKYDDLPSTATKNEEDNYIPGESGNAMDTSGIDGAIKNVQQSMSQIWNTITYFTDFVGLIFSALPTEIRTILLSALVVAIMIGLIKIFIGH